MPEPLTASEETRYIRQIALEKVGTEGQRRLKGASVIVVGAGGLGTPASVYLASAGVGSLGIVDHDLVQTSNLPRQFMYSEADVGKLKVDVLGTRLSLLNPTARIDRLAFRLDSSNALETLRGYDIVVDATDNLPSRYLLSDACVLLGKPDVYASAISFEGQATVFYPPTGPCYRCLFPVPPPPSEVRSCAEAGVIGSVTGVLGAVQAQQALSLLLGKGSSLVGRLLNFDGLRSSFEEVPVKPNPGCPACGKDRTMTGLIDYDEFCSGKMVESPDFDITVADLKAALDRHEDIELLDVREQYENNYCRLEGSKLIPLSQVPTRINEISKDKVTIIYCHTGNRSSTAVDYLRKKGYAKTRNLKGGIDEWSRKVDPSVPRY